ncbi:EAL domain-containing protein [Alicyclobacillus acidocaldarius]|uniref:Diguanylate phosphodiesterase n=1 Tax=Alicyclobacillus acidocaldarius (strain Tc-4-1) TaxID=1048834 RepID=F8IGL2_ALIAT|nr:EAL domain-containing protein [Alicyclobacillus acidocaldarius]AEJ44292.1 diguanylate phosphodiesterase [Alicyclobacillus acidocaldarius subsp. acidocaldarius Tc-4-1]
MTLRKQSIVRIPGHELYGYELLLAHPKDTLGLMAEAGLLGDLDRYILETARSLARTERTRIFVNATSELLSKQRLPFSECDDLSGVVLEITERSRLDMEAVAAYLAPFRARGLEVALDDFGTGFNGLSRWGTLRPDYIKVALTNEMAHFFPLLRRAAEELEATIIAERVETPGQERWLRELGIGFGQGFLYGKPTPVVTAS